MSSHAARSKARGFTLVELLVVIGIIALLIGILLPSLNKSRQAANDLACLANLRTIGQGLGIYANESRGWWPKPAGQLVVNGVTQPANTAPRDVWHRAAIYPALYRTRPDPTGEDNTYGYLKNTAFICPSAVQSWDGVTASDVSYGMNAQLNAFRNILGSGRNNYKRPSKVRNSAEVAAIMDSNMPWAGTVAQGATFSAGASWQVNWNDQLLAIQKALIRHRNRVNVLWVDGHASTERYSDIPLPGVPRDRAAVDAASPKWWRFWAGTE